MNMTDGLEWSDLLTFLTDAGGFWRVFRSLVRCPIQSREL